MPTHLGGWLVIVAVLVGAGVAGHHLSDRPMLAAQSGTSTSGGGTEGTSSDGSGSSGGGTSGGSGGGTSGGSGGGGGTGGSSGGGSTGGGTGGGGGSPVTSPTPTSPTPTPTTPAPTAPTTAPSGDGGSASQPQEDDGPDDGTSGFSPGDDGGGEHDDEPYTLRPAPDPAPERRQVAPGRKTDCPAGTPPEVRCFGVDDWENAEAVEVPDGAGGTVVVPLDADIDTRFGGTSASGGSNVDLRVQVDVPNGTVLEIERRPDDTTQAVLLTLAVILLVLALIGLGGTLLRLQGMGG